MRIEVYFLPDSEPVGLILFRWVFFVIGKFTCGWVERCEGVPVTPHRPSLKPRGWHPPGVWVCRVSSVEIRWVGVHDNPWRVKPLCILHLEKKKINLKKNTYWKPKFDLLLILIMHVTCNLNFFSSFFKITIFS